MSNIINKIENIDDLRAVFETKQKLKIDKFLNEQFAENLYKHAFLEKNWSLSTGINNQKYDKKDTLQNQRINTLQIENVNNAFKKDQFSYVFYRSMNGINMSYFEFALREILSSESFIDILNEITNLKLSKLTTLFMSKYKSGNFLSPHSDKGNGRLAFVINLSKFWKPQYGGSLHFMNKERTEITETYVPQFNNFLIFNVPEIEGISHFVGHVSPNIKFSRYAITGWFN